MNGTLSQTSELIFSLFVGIVVGVLYELLQGARTVFRPGRLIGSAMDVLFCLAAGAVYLLLSYRALALAFHWYILLGNLAGFLLERKSCGILLANFFEKVYNLITKRKAKRAANRPEKPEKPERREPRRKMKKRKGAVHDGEEN